ncbi:MAG TPA: glycosyltransferase [Blastocatellia bacterium]|nr:glycosyltransferase [Blastocatellia bacterium]
MTAKPIGLLWDSLSDNTGDQAIGVVLKRYLEDLCLPYEVLNPLSYDASSSAFVIVGGGELLRSKGDPYYDRFRLHGPHVLLAAGTHSPANLEYLNEYQIVTVRSEYDAQLIRGAVPNVEVMPCVSTLMPHFFSGRFGSEKTTGTLGVHVHYGTVSGVPDIAAALEELAKRWKLVFIPFTRYNADFELMNRLAARINNASVAPVKDPRETFQTIEQLDALICSSLHAAIFACASNVPFLVYPYAQKIRNFCEDRGLTGLLFESGAELVSKCRSLFESKLDFTSMIAADTGRVLNVLDRVVHCADRRGTLSRHPSTNASGNYAEAYYRQVMDHYRSLGMAMAESVGTQLDLASRTASLRTIAGQLEQTEKRASLLASELLFSQKQLEEERRDANRLRTDANRRILALQSELETLKRQRDEHKRATESLRLEIDEMSAEMAATKASLGWKLLAAYGKIKYRYLLPIYALFGQRPSHGQAEPELRWALDHPLPSSISIGRGNSLFISGWCYHSTKTITDLELRVDEHDQPLKALRMSRADLWAAHGPSIDPLGKSYTSGFWGFASVPAGVEQTHVALQLKATLDDRTELIETLARIPVEPESKDQECGFDAGRDQDTSRPLVAICMATYNPPADLLIRQLDTIRAQTHENWVCVISDDHSDQSAFRTLCEVVGDDPRFSISRSERRLGFYRNFERALRLAPGEASYIALSDQDDVWHSDKIATLLAEFSEQTTLVYADVNIVDREGTLIAGTYWTTRPNNYTDFSSLILANTITGAASMFRRELLEYILPFPERIGHSYHDHWIACVALALGEVKYVDRPLHNYVQHSGNVIGHCAPPPRTFVKKLRGAAGRVLKFRNALGSWRAVYFHELMRPELIARVLLLRCAERISPEKRAALRRMVSLDELMRSVVWLGLRSLRSVRGVTETLGAENHLFGAVVWKTTYRFKSWIRRRFIPVGKAAGRSGPGPVKAVFSWNHDRNGGLPSVVPPSDSSPATQELTPQAKPATGDSADATASKSNSSGI